MSLEKTHGIILKSIKYSDTDRILTCYTEKYGKIQCIAKRSRRKKNPFGPSIDLLTYAEIVVVKKGIKNIYPLREAIILRSYHRLYTDLPRLYAAFYMAELIQELTCLEDKRPEVLLLFLRHLEMLQKGEDVEKLVHIFEIRLLALLGYCPQLEKCLICLSPPESSRVGFIPSMGGIICPNCFQKKKLPFFIISMGSLNFLRQAVKFHLAKTTRLYLSPYSKKELQKVLYSFIIYYLEKDIQSYRFLLDSLKDHHFRISASGGH